MHAAAFFQAANRYLGFMSWLRFSACLCRWDSCMQTRPRWLLLAAGSHLTPCQSGPTSPRPSLGAGPIHGMTKQVGGRLLCLLACGLCCAVCDQNHQGMSPRPGAPVSMASRPLAHTCDPSLRWRRCQPPQALPRRCPPARGPQPPPSQQQLAQPQQQLQVQAERKAHTMVQRTGSQGACPPHTAASMRGQAAGRCGGMLRQGAVRMGWCEEHLSQSQTLRRCR